MVCTFLLLKVVTVVLVVNLFINMFVRHKYIKMLHVLGLTSTSTFYNSLPENMEKYCLLTLCSLLCLDCPSARHQHTIILDDFYNI